MVGSSSSAPTGAGRTGHAARSAGSMTTRWFTSRTGTRRPTPAGPARSCRPRPSGSSRRAAGSRAPSSPGATSSRRTAARWRTPGRASFPHENLKLDGYERTSPVTAFPPNGYGIHDMIGNVWEWTTDWFTLAARGRRGEAVLHPGEPARRPGRAELRPLPAADQDSAQGHQGRLAPVRAQLLPPLPPGRAPRPAGRHLDQPRRLPLRHQTVTRHEVPKTGTGRAR